MAKETLSNNLKNLLERKGKTQTDMAKELDLKESTVSSWINAVKYPRRDKIELLADYFGVMPSDITEDKQTQNNSIVSHLAAHLDGDLTDEEWQEVLDYAQYIRSKRK